MYIHARVTTGSKAESFDVVSATHFKIGVKEKPERNQANKRIVELIAQYFSVPPQKVHIVNGHHSPSKLLSVDID